MREVSSVEVKERCLDNSCAARGAFGLEIWTSTADLVDESFLAWPRDCLNGDGGRVVDLLSVPDDEEDRPITTVALVLTLAFSRGVGSTGMVVWGLVFSGEWGREGGRDWRVNTWLGFILAVTFTRCELVGGSRVARVEDIPFLCPYESKLIKFRTRRRSEQERKTAVATLGGDSIPFLADSKSLVHSPDLAPPSHSFPRTSQPCPLLH